MGSFTTISEALVAYEHWLARQPLSTHTCRTYLVQVRRYCTYLSTLPGEYGHPFQEPHARDYAVRDYKTTLKVVHLAKPSSVNLALAAIDHFYRFLELPMPQVAREDLPAQAPRALEPPEQKRFLRAVERCFIGWLRPTPLFPWLKDSQLMFPTEHGPGAISSKRTCQDKNGQSCNPR